MMLEHRGPRRGAGFVRESNDRQDIRISPFKEAALGLCISLKQSYSVHFQLKRGNGYVSLYSKRNC